MERQNSLQRLKEGSDKVFSFNALVTNYSAEVEKREWNVNSFLLLARRRHSARTWKVKAWQNASTEYSNILCASLALFTHKTPCIYMGVPQVLWKVSWGDGELGLCNMDHNLQLGLCQASFAIWCQCQWPYLKNHPRVPKFCYILTCKLFLELILTAVGEADKAHSCKKVPEQNFLA